MTTDWPALRATAAAAAANAYAPYSRLRVGAAGHAAGAGRLVAVSVVAGDGAPLVPCGRCRQLLLEAGGPGLLIDSHGGPRRLGELLPDAFTGTDLAERRDHGD